MLEQPLMTVHDTAHLLNVKESTIRAWIRNRKLRALKFGKEWRVDTQDLEDFMKQNANR